MKTSFATLVLLTLVLAAPLTAEENYVITINGTTKEINLNTPSTLVLPDGTSLKVTLRQKEYLRFTGDLISFSHKSKYKPNRTDLGDGIFQTMIVTPLGTGVLVQEYMKTNPTGLIDVMLKELTKEEVGVGYKYREKAIVKKVGDVTFRGKQAITTHTDEQWSRSVLAYAGKNKGVLIVTFIEKDNYQTDKDLVEYFWKTMELTANLKSSNKTLRRSGTPR